MNVKKILKRNLYPKNESDRHNWNIFIESLDENILWYPQAGSCFDYLYLFRDENDKFDLRPSLHIHTDFLPNEKIYDLITNKQLQGEDYTINVEDIIDLGSHLDYSLNFDFIHQNQRNLLGCYYSVKKYIIKKAVRKINKIFKPKTTKDYIAIISKDWFKNLVEKIKLIKFNIQFENGIYDGPQNRYVNYKGYILYFFQEKIEFFKNFILNEKMKISFIKTTNKDQFELIPCRLFELFLGFMNVKYLITGMDDIPISHSNILEVSHDFRIVLNSKKNCKYLLVSLDEYCEDSGIYKVKYF